MSSVQHYMWHGYDTTYDLDCDCIFCNYVKKYRGRGGFGLMSFKPHMIVPFDSDRHGPHEKYPRKFKEETGDEYNISSISTCILSPYNAVIIKKIRKPMISKEKEDKQLLVDKIVNCDKQDDYNPDTSIGTVRINCFTNTIFVCNLNCNCEYCEFFKNNGFSKINFLNPKFHNKYGHGFFKCSD